MTEFQVWLWFVLLPGVREALHSAQTALIIVGVFMAAAAVTLLLTGHLGDGEESVKSKQLAPVKSAIAIIILCLVLPFVRAAIPTEKQAAAIILIPAVTQSERIKGVGDKTLDMLNGKLDQWLKDMVGEAQKPEKGEKL